VSWLPLALATAVAFGLYNVFIKLGSGRIDQVLGAVILQLVAAAFGGGYALLLRLGGRELPVSNTGLLFAALAGVAVGLAEILTFVVFARGAPASLGSPIIMGGSVLVAALIGVVALRESLHWPQIAGIGLVVAGIALLSAGSKH
jgi:transporter family protein